MRAIKGLFLIILIVSSSFEIKGYNIPVNLILTNDTVIELSNFPELYSFEINGQAFSLSNTGFIRLVFEDQESKKYLIFEGSQMLSFTNERKYTPIFLQTLYILSCHLTGNYRTLYQLKSLI